MDEIRAAGGGKRLVIIAREAYAIAHNRDDLIRAALARGHRVLAVTPDAATSGGILEALGVESRAAPLRMPGLTFLADRKTEAELARILSDFRADVVLGCGSRALVVAAAAARKASVPRIVSLVTGLPETGFDGSDDFGVSVTLYKRAFRSSHAVIVHNSEDAARVRALGALPSDAELVEVPGAGVDLERVQPAPLPPLEGGLVFLMVSRLLRSRGVEEYISAARELKARSKGSRFLLAGPAAMGPDAVSLETLAQADGVIEYLGELSDVPGAISKAHVFVYPSHAEGMPRTVQEALAVGRPIVTSSIAGCREAIDERVNGCLAAPHEAGALAEAMESFLKRPDLIPAMARASRQKAERRFDVREVNRRLFEVLHLG